MLSPSTLPAPPESTPRDPNIELIAMCLRIERLTGQCEGLGGATPEPKLRRRNLVRNVQATLAIEGNRLSVKQVFAIQKGKRVLGSERETQEVVNAIAAYERLPDVKVRSEKDLLCAHATLMTGLEPDAGRYRQGTIGLATGPQAQRDRSPIAHLLASIGNDRATPVLVMACRFLRELETSRPFSGGNGPVGRLWLHALLNEHSKVFAHVPIMPHLALRRDSYHMTLYESVRADDARSFIFFMLDVIRGSLIEYAAVCRPRRLDADARLDAAADQFRGAYFSRKQYLEIHRGIASATASRDLAIGIRDQKLRGRGEKATAIYRFR